MYSKHCILNRQCDDLLNALLTFETDMYLEHHQKTYMMTAQDMLLKSRKNSDRHVRAKAIEDSYLKVKPANESQLKCVPQCVTLGCTFPM